MSADDFSKMMSADAGSTFNERMKAAQREMAQLQAIEKELKQDETKFNAQLQALRDKLETTTRRLSSLHATRQRLAKELAATDEEIATVETEKMETTQKIHAATSNASHNRDKKLRALDPSAGSAPPASKPAAKPASRPAAPPVADLLGGPAEPPSAPAVGGGLGDLLGDELMGSPAPAAQGSGLMDLMSAGFGAPSAPMPQPAAARPPPPTAAGSFEDSFGGFDVSDVAPSGGCGASSFAQPPKGMSPLGMPQAAACAGNPFGAAPAAPARPAAPAMSNASAPAAAKSSDPFAGLMGGLGR